MIIIKLSPLENHYSISSREKSIIETKFFTMIVNNIISAGLGLMVLGSYIYLFVKTDNEHYEEYYDDSQ